MVAGVSIGYIIDCAFGNEHFSDVMSIILQVVAYLRLIDRFSMREFIRIIIADFLAVHLFAIGWYMYVDCGGYLSLSSLSKPY